MNAEGQNTIYVYGGANMTMTPEDVINAKDAIINADFVVAQLKYPSRLLYLHLKLPSHMV